MVAVTVLKAVAICFSLTVFRHDADIRQAYCLIMNLMPHPSTLQQRMDDQSVLASRSGIDAVAQMHNAIAALYREQLIAVMQHHSVTVIA